MPNWFVTLILVLAIGGSVLAALRWSATVANILRVFRASTNSERPLWSIGDLVPLDGLIALTFFGHCWIISGSV